MYSTYVFKPVLVFTLKGMNPHETLEKHFGWTLRLMLLSGSNKPYYGDVC